MEQFKRWLLAKGYSLASIKIFTQGVKQYQAFQEEQAIIEEEPDFVFENVHLTNHVREERMPERLGNVSESTLIDMIKNSKQEAVYDGYEPNKDQHLFKVTIPAFNFKYVGGIDQNGDLIVITVL